MDEDALKTAAGTGKAASAADQHRFWTARFIGGVLILSLLCGITLFHTVSQAAISETVIELGDGEDLARDHHIGIFQTAYMDAAGEVTAQSGDGSCLIAPGTSGEHMIRLRNGNSFTVEYEICVDTSAQGAPQGELPICVRVTAAPVSPKSWRNIAGTVSDTLRGKLNPGQEMGFYYQWRWDEGDDAADTRLAQEYGDMELQVVANISAQEYIAQPQEDAGRDSEGNEDRGKEGESQGNTGGRGKSSGSGGSSSSQGTRGFGRTAGLWSSYGPGVQRGGTFYHSTQTGELGWVNIAESGEWYYSTSQSAAELAGWVSTDPVGIFKLGEGNGSMPDGLYTGWLYETRDRSWYYLTPGSGTMCSGWCYIDGSWYYFATRQDADDHAWIAEQAADGHPSWQYYGQGVHSYGAMYVNEYTPDGYFVDSEGRWVEGG